MKPSYIQEKNGYDYCTLCRKYAVEFHLLSDTHMRRVAWYESRKQVMGVLSAAQPMESHEPESGSVSSVREGVHRCSEPGVASSFSGMEMSVSDDYLHNPSAGFVLLSPLCHMSIDQFCEALTRVSDVVRAERVMDVGIEHHVRVQSARCATGSFFNFVLTPRAACFKGASALLRPEAWRILLEAVAGKTSAMLGVPEEPVEQELHGPVEQEPHGPVDEASVEVLPDAESEAGVYTLNFTRPQLKPVWVSPSGKMVHKIPECFTFSA